MLNTGLQKCNPNGELPHEISFLTFHILNQNKLYFETSMFMKIEISLHVSLITRDTTFSQRPPSVPRVRTCGRTRRHAISLKCIRFKHFVHTIHNDIWCVFTHYSRSWRMTDLGTNLNMYLVG